MDNVFITGASGFLGSKILEKLKGLDRSFVATNSKNCDLLDASSLRRFDTFKADYVLHLAAWTQAGDFCLHNAGNQWIINQKINTNILDWCVKQQPQAKFISMGTSCAYDPNMLHEEKNYLVGSPIESLFTYAMTKRMLHVGQLAANKQFGLQHLTFVPSTLYGPGYPTKGKQLHFIFDLIRKILRGKNFDEEVVLWGDGYQKRELIFIDDFISVLFELAPKVSNEIVNVGAGSELPIRYFAERICEIVDYPSDKIIYDTSKYVGAKSKTLDTTRLQNLCPDFRQVDLDKGLKETIDWCVATEIQNWTL